MKNITSKDLLDFGFTEEYVSAEESGQTDGYYYYVYLLKEGSALLISNASDECDGGYTVEFMDYGDEIQIKDRDDLQVMMAIIKKNLKYG